MMHPIVRDDDAEVDRLLALFNRHLCVDGFQLAVMDVVPGKRIFAAARGLDASPMHAQARKVSGRACLEHVAAQITRMQSSIVGDPALAIGSAKELVDRMSKGILKRREDRSISQGGFAKTGPFGSRDTRLDL